MLGVCAPLGRESVVNSFSVLTQKHQIFLVEIRFYITSSPIHALFPESSLLYKKAQCKSVYDECIGSSLKEGRIKVGLACTLTLHYLVFRRLILGTLHILEGH